MASYFGEVIEPTTRAIFNDYSDDEEDTCDQELQLSWSDGDEKLPSVLDVFFVFHGRLSLDCYKSWVFSACKSCNPFSLKVIKFYSRKAFAEAYILDENSSPVAEITVSENIKFVKDEDHHYKNLPSRLFMENNKLICLVSPTCCSEFGYDFTEILTPFLKISKKVIVFTNESIYNFKALSLNDFPPAFIRELKTSYNLSNNLAEKLPTPNFISGIPAGIISWCQIFKKDGSAFVCYSDQEKLDSITATPYLSIIKNFCYDIIKNESPNFNVKSFYGKPEVIGGSSNLYI